MDTAPKLPSFALTAPHMKEIKKPRHRRQGLKHSSGKNYFAPSTKNLWYVVLTYF